MNNILFKGVMPALITPFDSNGRIKTNTVKDLVNWHLSEKVDGFYVCGSTGEGPALRTSTRKEMVETVVESVGKRGKVIVHVGAPNILDAVELVEHATKTGADAVSSLAPTYSFKYSEDELVDYYKTISDHTNLPVLVYATAAMQVGNFPALMSRLIEIPNVIGVKFTIRDYFELRKTKEVNGGNINLINGPDETLICGLAMGADGGIGSTYNLIPSWFRNIYDCWQKGDVKGAQEWQYRTNHVIATLIRWGKIGAIRGTKAALELKGFDVGSAVYPARQSYTKEEYEALRKELVAEGVEI